MASQRQGGMYLDQNDIKAINDMLTKLPDTVNREKALAFAERKAAKVYEQLAKMYSASTYIFKSFHTNDKPQKGRNFINRLSETVTISRVRSKGGPPGFRVGFAAQKGRYVSFHANFLEEGTVNRSRQNGGSTGSVGSYKLQERIWTDGSGQAINELFSQLPKAIDRAYNKVYKGKK